MVIKSITEVSDVVYRSSPKYEPTEPDEENPEGKYHSSPAAWEDQVLYFLLPDRFSIDTGKAEREKLELEVYDSSQKDKATGENAEAWREAGGRFVGGTLLGVKEKLDYLKELGVSALWIGPVFKQVQWLETYHGYGVQDFLEVDPRFGSKEDLRQLVEAAHRLEIGNVFKYKLHDPAYTGSQYDVEGFYSSKSETSKPFQPNDALWPDGAVWPKELQTPECFTRKGRIRDWEKKPEFLDGDFFDLKDIALGNESADNFDAPSALRTLCEVYKYWLAFLDIDGYRIDTVKHMGDGPTRYFASVIHEYAQKLGKDKFLLIGEITGGKAYATVESTGLDAALGIGNVQEKLWKVPYGEVNPEEYFNLFRNALYLNKGSHTWFRDKVVTMIDDHDQVWKGDAKGRFCSVPQNEKLVASALMLNLCTLGIPCIYYGTEQALNGHGGSDRYIREAMFGNKFGAFGSKGAHFFDPEKAVYLAVQEVAKLRRKEIALRRGRQYLRDVSENGEHFGPTRKWGEGRIKYLVAWSRLFADEEVLCVINTDPKDSQEAWITVDAEINPRGTEMRYLIPSARPPLIVERRSDRACVRVGLGPGGHAILKK
ncbi:hypothetical protein LTR70_009660 [Exophiala xenobiotica]|uniref:Glycosyl hydrolase family 13 catalytic domain-containing protein n=1 Tax=Lithohypha guttulata TaxID=1690604 RepID=A0ABR0JWX2_9EURO|nr:hypothetical protein LTR24_009553 [Lithohypha guttulata]KAK5310189.1 hypothetical protein LTR70_009660 [Exophiala xenobiotica]